MELFYPHNILAISSWYPTANKPGFGIFVQRHLMEIAQRNTVNLLYFDFDSKVMDGASRCSIRVCGKLTEHIVAVGGRGGVLASFFRTVYWYLKLVVFGPLRNHQIKHLHIPYHIGIFIAPFLLLSFQPMIISEHWSGYFREDGRFSRLSFSSRLLLKALFRKASAITAVSKPLLDSMDEYFHVKDKANVIPNAYRKNMSCRNVDAIIPGRFLMVANINNAEKNITGVIEAFHRLWIQHPYVQLTIVGSGPDFKLVQDFRDHLGLSDHVCTLTGYVESKSLSMYYQQASCYVMNSNFETFSISTLEALLSGVPVISTKCKGPESFVNDSNGLLIDVGNTGQLESAMEYMLTHYRDYEPEKIRASIPAEMTVDIGVAFTDIYDDIL